MSIKFQMMANDDFEILLNDVKNSENSKVYLN